MQPKPIRGIFNVKRNKWIVFLLSNKNTFNNVKKKLCNECNEKKSLLTEKNIELLDNSNFLNLNTSFKVTGKTMFTHFQAKSIQRESKNHVFFHKKF